MIYRAGAAEIFTPAGLCERCAGLLICCDLPPLSTEITPSQWNLAVGVVVLHVNATVFLYYMDLPNERARFSIFWRKKNGLRHVLSSLMRRMLLPTRARLSHC